MDPDSSDERDKPSPSFSSRSRTLGVQDRDKNEERERSDDDRTEQGLLWNGYGDTLTKALDFAVIPLLFGGAGYALDNWLGITPVFTIVLVVVALVGLFLRLWYAYEAAMQAEEAQAPWAPRTGRP